MKVAFQSTTRMAFCIADDIRPNAARTRTSPASHDRPRGFDRTLPPLAPPTRTQFPHRCRSRARPGCSRACRERTVYRRCLEGGPVAASASRRSSMLFTGHPTVDQLVHAALAPLRARRDGDRGSRHVVVMGYAAGPSRRGDAGNRYPEIHVLVPEHRQVRSVEFVHVERTMRPPSPGVLRGGVPLAPLVRACTDAARRIRSPAEVTELLSDAVQRGLCTVAHAVGGARRRFTERHSHSARGSC